MNGQNDTDTCLSFILLFTFLTSHLCKTLEVILHISSNQQNIGYTHIYILQIIYRQVSALRPFQCLHQLHMINNRIGEMINVTYNSYKLCTRKLTKIRIIIIQNNYTQSILMLSHTFCPVHSLIYTSLLLFFHMLHSLFAIIR